MSMKDDSLFFCNIEKNEKNKDFIEKLEHIPKIIPNRFIS